MTQTANHRKEAKSPKFLLVVIWIAVVILAIPISGLGIIGMIKASGKDLGHLKSFEYSYEYKLSAGQKTYTQVAVGPGVILRILANQPFSVIASQSQSDGSIKTEEYIMPAGESGWLGGEPAGVFTIQGITNDTLVKISQR